MKTQHNIIFSLALIGLSASVNAANLESPTLLKPDNNANLQLKKAAKFTWQKVTGATKYRLIFSNDRNFANYDAKKFKCLNTKTCFLYTITSTAYNVLSSSSMLKTDANYFWQVQSVGKTIANNSKTGEIRAFSVGTPTVAHPKITNFSFVPKGDVMLGSNLQIRATLDKPLSDDSYSLQISINDEEFQPMTQAKNPINFSFNYTSSEIGEQKFVINIFDENGEIVDSNSGNFNVISNSQITEIEDISGTYQITGTADETECGDGIRNFQEIASVSHVTDNNIFVTVHGQNVIAQLLNDTISYRTSYAEDGGTTNVNGVISVIGNQIQGNATWTWTNNEFSCSGTDKFSGQKQN